MPKLYGQTLSKTDILKRIGDISQIAGAHEYVLSSGRAKGVKAIDVRNGSGLNFTILPDRGMDISYSEYNGVPFAFISKTGVVAPEFYNEKDFLRSFYGGFLTTCGLTYMGAPCEDLGVSLGAHGRIANTPCHDIGIVQEWIDDDFVIKIRGKATESTLFGEHIVLTREIIVKLGENTIKINDTVENCGFDRQPLMLLYHFNFGYPLLDSGTELITNCTDTKPRDDEAVKGINDFSSFDNPIHGYKEQVFYHKPHGKSFAGLYNKRLGMGVKISFESDQLPHLIQWKQVGEGDYTCGIEPATWYPEGRAKARQRDELLYIEPQQKMKFELTAEII